MLLTLPYPQIDPVALELGPLVIRWYALAYIGGLLIGWRYARALAAKAPQPIAGKNALTAEHIDDLLLWVTLGVILGGRFGYVFFYNAEHYLSHPGQILFLWQGGMSFHGGLIGVILAVIAYTRVKRISLLSTADVVACATPIGLFLGRVANFINGELYGRPTDVPWAMVFPFGGPVPRHPSQLYEAVLEGLLLFVVLFVMQKRGALQQPGTIGGIFLLGYGLGRFTAEIFREPDAHLGFIAMGTTMGQILSIPMILAGLGLFLWARRQPPRPL